MVIHKSYTHLQLNDEVDVKAIDEGSISSTFELALEVGDLDIRAWFDDSEDASDKPLAAIYIYRERL